MASRWELMRDAVASAIEALTPETDANITYRDAETDAVLQGASGRRAFFMEPPSAQVMTQQDSTTIRVRYQWSLYLRLSRAVGTIPEVAEACTTEPLNLTRAITTMAPTTGADPVQVTGWQTQAFDGSDELEIVIDMFTEIDEVL